MRVLHVITSLADGGAEAVLTRLVAHDTADSHHVVSLTDMGKYGSPLRQAGATVTALEMPRGRTTLRGLHGLYKLWRAVRAWRPDVVQTWMYHADLLGGLAGRLAGPPVVWGIRNTTLEAGRSSAATVRVARLCARLSRWLPTRIVACAQAAVRVHAALGYDAGRMVVIPNGYDLARLAPDPEARARLRAEWDVPDDLPLVGMVARLDPQKDHVNLLRALTQLVRSGFDFRIVLVGDGPLAARATLAAGIEDAGLDEHVCLLGTRMDIPDIMNALDVHVLSSAYGEAFPNVLAEAMACGTPCVTTDVGDAAAIVGETGWVVPPRDAQALAAALAAALDTWRAGDEWRARQQCARDRIGNQFGLDKMVEQYRAVWAQVAAGGSMGKGKHSCAA